MSQPVFRFAPSPTGFLHLGHAYAALYNQKICKAHNGKMLLRMENTDLTRCRPEFEAAIIDDLSWMGFKWQEDIRRQSEHFSYYSTVMQKMKSEGLVYPSVMSRGQIRQWVLQFELSGDDWPRDPDGSPFYPGKERELDKNGRMLIEAESVDYALRMDMKIAMNRLSDTDNMNLTWQEFDAEGNIPNRINCQPELWGDVVLGRKDIPVRYHLACVIDDGLQGVTHVVRGMDVFPATSIHRILQELLGIKAPLYCHHDLMLDQEGHKLSKRRGDDSIQSMRKAGMTVSDLYEMIGISP